MLTLFLILSAEPKPDPTRKLGSTIRPKTQTLLKKNQEVTRIRLVNRRALILKPPLTTCPFKAKTLMNQQTLSLPRLTLNRQSQTGLVR